SSCWGVDTSGFIRRTSRRSRVPSGTCRTDTFTGCGGENHKGWRNSFTSVILPIFYQSYFPAHRHATGYKLRPAKEEAAAGFAQWSAKPAAAARFDRGTRAACPTLGKPVLARRPQVGQLLLDRGVMARLHGERRGAAGGAAQVAGIAEERRERHVGVDHTAALVQLGVEDFAAPPVQIADQLAHVLARGMDDHVHNRLQQHQTG